VPARTPELEAQLAALLAEPNTWIVTSSEAMRGLVSLAADRVAQLQQQHFLVPHARIAETARALGLTDVTLTPSGDEGLFAALQSRV
jgi:uroporphyrinogen-III synthase